MESGTTGTCRYCGVELDPNQVCPLCGEVYREDRPEKVVIPTREQLPSTEPTHKQSCKICGYVLTENSTSCPMCGSPVIEDVEEAPEYRCPVCEDSLEMEATECQRCGVNLTGKEEQEELSFKCPVCQKEMHMDDQTCTGCGAKIWLDLGEEVRRIEEYRCPMCDKPVQEETEKCPSCGADVWMRDEDALKDEATAKIDEAITQIKMEKEETDSDLGKAIRFLTVAKEAYEMNDFMRATRCASLSIDLARSEGLQKRILADALHRAERMVSLVDEKGGDVARARELLESSKTEVGKGNYRRAVKMAIRGKVLAESSIPQDVVLMIDADSLQ